MHLFEMHILAPLEIELQEAIAMIVKLTLIIPLAVNDSENPQAIVDSQIHTFVKVLRLCGITSTIGTVIVTAPPTQTTPAEITLSGWAWSWSYQNAHPTPDDVSRIIAVADLRGSS